MLSSAHAGAATEGEGGGDKGEGGDGMAEEGDDVGQMQRSLSLSVAHPSYVQPPLSISAPGS